MLFVMRVMESIGLKVRKPMALIREQKVYQDNYRQIRCDVLGSWKHASRPKFIKMGGGQSSQRSGAL